MPTRALIEVARQLKHALDAEQHELLTILGEYLVTRICSDYETKSRGGTGEDGISWAAPKLRAGSGNARPRKNTIGIRTGRQIASIQFEVQGSGNADSPAIVLAGASTNYAAKFDRLRPITTDSLPEKWLSELEVKIEDHANEVVERALK